MPRKKAAVPKSLLKAYIPLDLRARLDLALVSELEGRVPLGQYSQRVEGMIREYLDWDTLDLMAYGFPQGYFVRGPRSFIQSLKAHLEELHRTMTQKGGLTPTNVKVEAPDAVT